MQWKLPLEIRLYASPLLLKLYSMEHSWPTLYASAAQKSRHLAA
jgi:hypothetical protein